MTPRGRNAARVLNRLLMAVVLAAVPGGAAAQHAAPRLEAPARASGVTLTVAAYLLPSASGELMMPPALLERLAAEDALLAVDTEPVGGRVVVQVRFGFPDVAAFRRWYADERTARLLNEVRATTLRGSFETFVSYRPEGTA